MFLFLLQPFLFLLCGQIREGGWYINLIWGNNHWPYFGGRMASFAPCFCRDTMVDNRPRSEPVGESLQHNACHSSSYPTAHIHHACSQTLRFNWRSFLLYKPHHRHHRNLPSQPNEGGKTGISIRQVPMQLQRAIAANGEPQTRNGAYNCC